MPELPDVEIFKRYMNATALHQNISDVEVFESKVLKNISASDFKSYLKKKDFLNTDRYGKNLFVQTSGQYLLRLHFGMTGFLKYFKNNNGLRHVRLLFSFTNGFKLAYICQRLLGQVSLENSISDFVDRRNLGIDALKMSLEEFQDAAGRTKQTIKSLLMDQRKIAGLGNIYTDEILFQSGLHPKNITKNLHKKQVKKIYKNINRVLLHAIDCKVDPERFDKSYLLPQRSKRGECPRCGTSIERIQISGRTSYFCPKCQKK